MRSDSEGPDQSEDSGRSSHFSRKELRNLLLVVGGILLGLFFIYPFLRKQSEKHLCKQNMASIGKAIGLYAASNDDHFPLAFATDDGTHPVLDSRGHPFTWVSVVSEYMNDRSSFKCPSSGADENVENQHRSESAKSIISSYGMFGARSGVGSFSLRNPGGLALVLETSSLGANDTFDPIPLTGPHGERIRDGFMVGFDDNNFTSSKVTKAITRLGYGGTSKGAFSADGATRHEGGNFILYADLHAAPADPTCAKVRRVGSDLEGIWSSR